MVSQQFDVFLSYNSRDRAVVERIAKRLQRAGVQPWLDRWSLTPGEEWQRELGAGLEASAACAVFVGPQELGGWELEEVALALDRAATHRGFRVFPVLLPGVEEPFDPNRLPHFLRTRTWVDFRRARDDQRALQDLINAVKGVAFGPDVRVEGNDQVAPYRGLRFFGEEDAQLFFGRDREVQRLVEKLKESRFVAVLGPSGSGKSSLVRAGLVPHLRAGALVEVEGWHVLVLRPGAAPLTALAAQLAKLLAGQAMQATLDALAQDARSLHLSVELALSDRPPDERVLVFVDQLEEVFTLCRDEAQRQQFFSMMLDATSAPGGRTVVIVTMRADFYVRCAAYPEFAQLISAHQMLVGPLDADGLRQAIEEPARRVGLELEEGLSDTILADVAAEPGALPLLEHALLELWERRRGTMLTLEGYRQAGGVHGALAQRADDIYQKLTSAQQQIARRALLRLTQPGEGTEDTRRRAFRDELASAEGDDGFDEVLARLVDARLLTTGCDETGADIVDVSHEALIRGWPRLRGWIDMDRAGLLIHRRLTEASREWTSLDREPGALYRGARLASAGDWASDHDAELSVLERDFLRASRRAEYAELEAARLRMRRLRVLSLGLAALVAVAVIAISAVVIFANRANVQQRATEASRLASQAATLVDSDPGLALTIARVAVGRLDIPAAQNAVRQATLANRASAVIPAHRVAVYRAALSADGSTVATASEDGSVKIASLDAARVVATIDAHKGPATDVSFSPDRKHVASVGTDGNVVVAELDGKSPRVVHEFGGRDVYARSVEYDARGRRLLLASTNGNVVLRDVDGLRSRTLAQHAGVRVARFDGRGARVLSAGGDGYARLWNRDGRAIATFRHGGIVFDADLSADGRWAATAGEDGVVRIWSVRSGRLLRSVRLLAKALYSVQFDAGGRRVVTSAEDGVVRVSDARDGAVLAELRGHRDSAWDAAFGGDGGTVYSVGMDGTLRTWAPLQAWMLSTKRQAPPFAPSFNPTSGLIVSGYEDGAVRVWNPAIGSLRELPRHEDASAAVYSADGSRILSYSSDGTVRLHDVKRRRWSRVRLPDRAAVFAAAIDPPGNRFAIARQMRRVLIQARDGRGRVTLPEHGQVNWVAFSTDGKHLLTASDDGTVRTWNATTGARERVLRAGSAVLDARYSPDDKRIAAAGADGSIRIWRLDGSGPVVLYGHDGPVNTLGFNRKGDRLASGGSDGTVRVWDPRGGDPVVLLHTHEGDVSGVAFSAKGERVVSGADDGIRVSVCEVCGSFSDVVALAETRRDETLTRSERARLLADGG